MASALVKTRFHMFVSDFAESKVALSAFLVLCSIITIALFAPLLSPQNPYDLGKITILDGRLPPGSESIDGTTYWLGSDDQGRDLLSAIFYGLRISLGVGVVSGTLALIVGGVLGILGAYAGGKVDALIMRSADLFLAFPSFLIALILLAVLGRGVGKVVVALVLSQWANFARVARGAAVVERGKEYVEAARCLALPRNRIVFRHLLPNCLPPLIVIGTINISGAITLEASLSFLGVGLPITEPSLGLLIANGYEYILSGKYWLSFFPGIALLVTIASINLVADQLREVLNPRLKR